MRLGRNGEEFLSDRDAGDDGFAAEPRGGLIACNGEARRESRENTIRESRLAVGLENDRGNAMHRGEEHHWSRGVPADAEGCAKIMTLDDFFRIKQGGRKHGDILVELRAADAFQA